MNENSEALLVEQPAIAVFAALGYQTVNATHERFGERGTLGRQTTSEVVLLPRLQAALRKLNPDLPPDALHQAEEALTRSHDVMSLVDANREVYKLLKDGVSVQFTDATGTRHTETAHVIDWQHPDNNDFLLVSQLTIISTNGLWRKRPDVIAFVNGLPLVVCEFKASHKAVEDAYNDNLTDYKDTIPHLFWYNALLIISNGDRSLLGSLTSGLEHFFEWKRVESEDEADNATLATLLRGTCEKRRLLDIVENFTLFSYGRSKPVKIIARNHQYLGVNNALEAVYGIRNNQGRLGVFWHTQGSGKSYSMIFFSQKVQRKLPGNWTFVLVTDRKDLDTQIYSNFANAGVVTELEQDIHAEDGEHLKALLRANHRVVFTLIQKFHTKPGTSYEQLSDRSDIIVMTDEAHRSQYDIFARNMRRALPNAAFIGFTGTPLMLDGSEGETQRVFGDYVSVYNFRKSVDDGSTVPLYYENRIPEVELTTSDLNRMVAQIIDDADLDELQEQRIEREFAREYHIITSNDRLEKIAQDIVAQFMGRGYMGKAMVITFDKITAVRMYDKVQKYWQAEITRRELQLAQLTQQATDANADERDILIASIDYMKSTDMAVVVSQDQNDIKKFREKGLDILPHRERIVKEDLDAQFKDSANPLRIVFVCAMWITGFDVPSLSTIYLDKPMSNHTLMQTIARANRVFQDKANGLIVDYIGVFRDLQKALAIYGSASGGGIQAGDSPVADKSQLVAELKDAMIELLLFCKEQGFDPRAIASLQGEERRRLLENAEDMLLVNDEIKKHYLSHARHVIKLYNATLPSDVASQYNALVYIFKNLVERILLLTTPGDISKVMAEIERIIQQTLVTRNYLIREQSEYSNYDPRRYTDLSKIDFDALRANFAAGHPHREVAALRTSITNKLNTMLQLNKSRVSYQEKFQQLIDAYNEGSLNNDIMVEQLISFIQTINAEEQRHISEQLSEEELAVFDMLNQPNLSLSEKEQTQVKKVVRDLLSTLKREKLVLDWRKKQQSQARVKQAIRDAFRTNLPHAYTLDQQEQLSDLVYQHIYDSYAGPGRSIYATA